MLTYTYTAKNSSTGQKIKSQVQAQNEQAAAKLVRDQGLTLLSIKAENVDSKSIFKRIKSKDKVLFSRQLATLINAGLPLVQSLRQVAEQTANKPLKAIVNQVIVDVEGGISLSVALERHPDTFNQVFVSLVASGEASGTLDKTLERLADQQEKDADVVSKVRGAMIYPIIVLLVMFGVVIFMVVKVLPQVKNIYAGLPGASLPILTRSLLALSDFVIHDWWIALAGLIITVFLLNRWAHTEGGRAVMDRLKMRIWPIGPLFMKMYMARFARTGTTLVASGVPLIQMMDITGNAVNNVHINSSLKRASEKVKGGKALSDSIEGDPNFLPLVPSMLRIGEQSGAIETMLSKVADYYEREVDNQIKTVSTIIEPVMMVIMGIIAIVIVAAILLPIYGLVNQSGFTNSG